MRQNKELANDGDPIQFIPLSGTVAPLLQLRYGSDFAGELPPMRG